MFQTLQAVQNASPQSPVGGPSEREHPSPVLVQGLPVALGQCLPRVRW